MKTIYESNSHTIYYYTLEKQKNQIQKWLNENIIPCDFKEGVLLNIMYDDFCDRNKINTNKLTKRTFAKFLCILLKANNINYKIVNKQSTKGKTRQKMYLGITLPVLK